MIADFGLSKSLQQLSMTKTSSEVLGMPAYVDPQYFITDDYKKNEKSDIYSLGVLFWEISSGKTPFSDTNGYKIILDVVKGRREIPVKNTPSEYQKLYENCWKEEPDQRPNINEIYEVLNRLELQYNNNEQTEVEVLQNLSDYQISSTLNTYNIVESLLNNTNQDGKIKIKIFFLILFFFALFIYYYYH